MCHVRADDFGLEPEAHSIRPHRNPREFGGGCIGPYGHFRPDERAKQKRGGNQRAFAFLSGYELRGDGVDSIGAEFLVGRIALVRHRPWRSSGYYPFGWSAITQMPE